MIRRPPLKGKSKKAKGKRRRRDGRHHGSYQPPATRGGTPAAFSFFTFTFLLLPLPRPGYRLGLQGSRERANEPTRATRSGRPACFSISATRAEPTTAASA